MKNIGIVFPHQLFENNELINSCKTIYLIEEYLFFKQFKFHKQKLVYHRATMKFYENYLKSLGIDVIYIDSFHENSDVRNLIPFLKIKGIENISYFEVSDNWIEKRIKENTFNANISTTILQSPYFLNTNEEIETYFITKNRMFQTDFYKSERIKRNILIDENKKPIGGKWTYDDENRLKYPKNKIPPKINKLELNEYLQGAISYVGEHFKDNYGDLNSKLIYPTTFEESKKWLQEFLEQRFYDFGFYEDALVLKEHTLHHSILTPMLNIGLLTPNFIIDETIKYAEKNEIPLNSLEGFIRQIVGWREFIKAVYHLKGNEERTKNYWKFDKKIPHSFYNGTTGILPIDETIKKIIETGYAHHIERLMVLGNFMLLCEFDPDEVYKWFMELFIDAYDWVMVPNVYGMSQFADGGLMATKPYISGSNYLMKMSDYPKGDWQPIWDGLFWRFMHKQRNFFLQNPRLGMLINMFDKMPEEKQKKHIEIAEEFLNKIGL